MYDLHKELNDFYKDHVCLSSDDKRALAGYRDTNIARLKSGLEKLEYPSCFEAKNQGSYAMGTINQHPEKEYDIDVAIIFKKEELPYDPADARKRMEAAMCEAGGNFLTPPEAKTNAMRISYVEGYHVDLAVYREATDILGNPIIEHAGPGWTVRDPMEINNWFTELVQRRSPSKKYGAQVDDGQVRRVVRWLKMFARSRSSWNMPGGLIISALVGECYIPDGDRDDVSLHRTMESIRNRLSIDKNVNNPVNSRYSLTERGKDKTKVNNLETNLTPALEKMAVLFQADCDRQKALQAWDGVFNHSYWQNEIGKCLKDSIQAGFLGVTKTGLLSNTQANNRSIPVPNTRFYGE